VTKRPQPCFQAGNLGGGQAWMRIGVLVALGCIPPLVSAQNCTASNPQLAVTILQTVLATCSSYSDFPAMEYRYGHDVIFVQASVAGNLAIPVLRQFASLPQHNACTGSTFDAAARTALAKLGDENAYAAIKQQWSQHRAGPYQKKLKM
jgi:hypothetical protein